MCYLYSITILILLLSFLFDHKKTFAALQIAYKKFTKIFPAFLSMLSIISIVLFIVPDNMISKYLGHTNKFSGMFLGTFLGSITIMPGFIAFPLAGILLKKGVCYMVISSFTTTLMMVGIVTYPIEKEYLGARATILRNVIGFLIALTVALCIGVFFGEI